MPLTSNKQLDLERLEIAVEAIKKHGDQIAVDKQKSILEQKIVLGMTPYEAKLAGGAYFFHVKADPSVWMPNADPNIVISAQTAKPDNSKIWLTFETTTQFLDEGLSRFVVYFEQGKAINIEKSNES